MSGSALRSEVFFEREAHFVREDALRASEET